MELAVGAARTLSRFLSTVVDDTIEVPQPGADDVFYSTEDLYRRYAEFCEGEPSLSIDDFDRVLTHWHGWSL